MVRALYPGTFDPIHNGHIDIVVRAARSSTKWSWLSTTRHPKSCCSIPRNDSNWRAESVAHIPNIQVITYTGLTIECAARAKSEPDRARLAQRGGFRVRAADRLGQQPAGADVDLCCLFCNNEYAYLSATILKEVASLGGDCAAWAPPHVLYALGAKFDRPN